MTAAEILELDAYCRAHFIDLVPNQNRHVSLLPLFALAFLHSREYVSR